MGKRSYEITFILPATLSEAEIQQSEEKVTQWITSAEGDVTKSNHWGRRRLAYTIGAYREGYYILLEADIPPEGLDDFNYRMNIDQNILRYLVVRTDE
jgi:small subunit ribosomal protein S6